MEPVIFPGVTHFTRDEFLALAWEYHAGEHLACFAQTGWGKTDLLEWLVANTATPKMPVVVLATKPRDATLLRAMKRNRWKMVRDWPPNAFMMAMKPSGWVLWPKHSFDPDVDDVNHARIFRKTLLWLYKKGGFIILDDEILALMDLALKRVIDTILGRARAMGTGHWGGTQAPVGVPTTVYRQAQHLLFGGINDEAARKRFREIGGTANKDLIDAIVQILPLHWWLYVRTTDGTMCIIGPS